MDLKPSRADRATSIARSVFGAAPVVGPLLSEVISELIPNQRIDRLAEFVEVLNAKVEALGQERVAEELSDEEFVDLLEDGFQHAARAISTERKQYIASVIASGLTDEHIRHTQSKALLSMLRELSDPEVIVLQFYAKAFSDDHDEYRERHAVTIFGDPAHLGPSPEQLDQDALHGTYKAHLQRLGLITPNFRKPKRGELPEFDDKTGMMRVGHHGVTWLGRLLLRFIGLDDGMAQTGD
jgi:hypothetical protein